MDKHHPHAKAIDKIGYPAIRSHFGITRQAIWAWKRNGVPPRHRKTLGLLAAVGGHDVPELFE